MQTLVALVVWAALSGTVIWLWGVPMLAALLVLYVLAGIGLALFTQAMRRGS